MSDQKKCELKLSIVEAIYKGKKLIQKYRNGNLS